MRVERKFPWYATFLFLKVLVLFLNFYLWMIVDFFYNFHMIFFFIFILTVWLFCGVLLFFLNFLTYFVAISLVFRVCYISDVIYCLSTFLIQKKLYKKKLNKIKYFHKYLLMFPFFFLNLHKHIFFDILIYIYFFLWCRV